MTLALARAAFGALAVALLAVTAYAVALDKARRSPWWIAARWAAVADAARLAGCVLLGAAVLLLGLAAFPPGP